MISVVVIDDHQIIRDAVRDMLRETDGIDLIEAYDSAEAFLNDPRRPSVDVVVLDYMLPGVNGIDFAGELLSTQRGRAIVLLTQFVRFSVVQKAAIAGLKCLVSKERAVIDLPQAIIASIRGAHFLCPVFLSAIFHELQKPKDESAADNAALTKRETLVLKYLVTGATRRQISDELFISAATVTTHRRRIMTKLGAHSTAELMQAAMRLGIL